MGKLFKTFEKYFNSISKEQKQKDFEELKEYNKIGPVIKH